MRPPDYSRQCFHMENQKISRQEVERAAAIARLKPSAGQAEALAKDANAILEYFSLIGQIPSGVQPRAYVLDHANPLRPDERKKSDPAGIRRGFAKEQDGYLQAQKSV